MQVWTLKMNFVDKTDLFKFCKENNLIGFGWALPNECVKSPEINSIDAFITSKENYEPYKDSQQLTTCLNAFKEMNPGDLIWTLDERKSIYYLCKTTGEYRYLNKEYADKYGVANCMEVEGYNPISENLVPPDVKRLLHSPGIIYKLDEVSCQKDATEYLYNAIEKLNL